MVMPLISFQSSAEALLRAQQEEEARLERERLYRELVERLEAKCGFVTIIYLLFRILLFPVIAGCSTPVSTFLCTLLQWEHYLSCDGAPDPTVPQEINTFMSLWRDEQDQDVQLVMEKGEVVLHLIEKLQFLLLETAPEDITDEKQEQYLQVILQLQDLLHQKYNDATQSLLKIASMYEDSESGNMHTVLKDINVTFCLWANLKMKDHVFQEAGHAFELPMSLALSSVAVRVLYTRYDHVSPLWVSASLKETSNNKDDIKETQEETEKNSENLEEPSQGIWLLFMCSTTKVLRLSILCVKNCSLEALPARRDRHRAMLAGLSPAELSLSAALPEEEAPLQEEPGGGEEAPRVVDLEQLVPVGGVFHISVLRLPPQAQDVGDWIMVELLDVGLEEYPYSPGKAEDGTQEAVQITLRLPDNVIYFEVPVLARWDPAGLNFRHKFISNLSKLKSSSVLLCFHWFVQQDNQCMLSSVVVEEKEVLSHITGKWMSPVALRAALKRAGVNIFPAEHSPKYVPVPRKVSARGSWWLFPGFHSGQPLLPWELLCCFTSVHFFLQQVSEHLTAGSAKGSHWSLLMFDGEKVQHLKLTETSEAFSEEVQEESEFHSTLYHMVKEFASSEAMEKVERAGCMFIDSVYQLLLATRVLAFS
uniref:Dynein axonemal intermediate chain 7 n=1 Tax=Zonotrichia albicollis TaxID=44394 RepID=A0A8D2LYS8_ZONAL